MDPHQADAVLQSSHHSLQQQLQSQQSECSTLKRQLGRQTQLTDAVETEVKAVKGELAEVLTEVTSIETRGGLQLPAWCYKRLYFGCCRHQHGVHTIR